MSDHLEVRSTSMRGRTEIPLDVRPVEGAEACTISERVDIEDFSEVVEYVRAVLHDLELW